MALLLSCWLGCASAAPNIFLGNLKKGDFCQAFVEVNFPSQLQPVSDFMALTLKEELLKLDKTLGVDVSSGGSCAVNFEVDFFILELSKENPQSGLAFSYTAKLHAANGKLLQFENQGLSGRATVTPMSLLLWERNGLKIVPQLNQLFPSMKEALTSTYTQLLTELKASGYTGR